MRNKENLHEPFSVQARYAKRRKPSWYFPVQSRYAKRSSVAYLRPSESHPLSLATEACPPYPPTIDRITKQRYKPRAKPKNQEQKRKKRKPMHKRTKNETKRKKKIKITTSMLFSSLLRHTYKRNTYFFSFINGQQKPSKWPINLQNMPNGVAKHAKSRHERCLTETRYMPNRNTKDALSQCQTCLIAKRIYLYGYFYVFCFIYICLLMFLCLFIYLHIESKCKDRW